jgi:hypothetical protein
MRRPPPPHPRGAPRTPGSGRRRGTPNRKTVELRQLMAALAGDVDYQEKFRRAWVKRRLHPSVEIKVWEYALGKPAERVQLSADVTMAEQRERELESMRFLTIEQMEELAAESQALVDKAMAMAAANSLPPAPANARRAPAEYGDIIDVGGSTSPHTDATRCGDRDRDRPFKAESTEARTPVLESVLPSPTGGVQEVRAEEPAKE